MNTVEHFICSIVCANNFDKDHWPPWKTDILPGLAGFFRTVPYNLPITSVVTYFNVIGISTFITIPQEQPKLKKIVFR